MKFNLNKYYDTISFNYINEIYNTIFRDIVIASEKDQTESFNQLLEFIIYNLKSKSFNKSKKAYSKSVTLLIYIYPKLSPKYKRIFIEKTFESLITSICLANDYEHIKEKYIELSYLPLINIFKIILQNDDYDLFNVAKNKFNNTLFKIENKKDKNHLFFYFNTTLISWIYFLISKESISYEKYEFSYFENNLQSVSYRFEFNFINHFFDLFDGIEKNGLWAVSDWEVEEPPVNKVYTALSAHNWLPYGLTLILMKFEHLISLKTNYNEIKLNRRFRYLDNDIKKMLDNITLESIEYEKILYNNIPNQSPTEALNFKKEKILSLFSFLKKEIEIDYYKKIKEIPLSNEKIQEFRNNVGNLWENNSSILIILKNLEKIEFLPNDKEIKGYGFFQRLLKMKFAFIDGEHYQNIFGLSEFGSRLARNIDNDFFNNIDINNVKSTNKIKENILAFTNEIENKKNLIIFANWRNTELIGDITYENKSKNSLYNKRFKGIPILQQYSKFEDSILIIDFSLIKVQIYTSDNPNWYKKQLLVEITNSQKEDITEDVIKEWNDNEGYEYNKNEVDILESNNVNAKIILKYKFIIPKESKHLLIKPI